MYYTGLDPFTGKEVYVPKDYNEKKMQRALLQSSRPENRQLVEKAIAVSKRNDARCLLPYNSTSFSNKDSSVKGRAKAPVKPEKKKGGVKKGKGSDTAAKRKALKEKNKVKSK